MRQTRRTQICLTVPFACDSEYLHSACEVCGKVSLIIGTQLDKSKIRYLGIKVGIQQNVAGLDVPMYNLSLEFIVQILQTSSSISGNFKACWPINVFRVVSPTWISSTYN